MKIVVKVGTGVLTRQETGTLDETSMIHLVGALAALIDQGHRVMLVSSGAVGAGVSAMGLDSYPSDVPTKQACASIGQSRLMHLYQTMFGYFDVKVAQLLLTADDLKHRGNHVRATLDRLFSMPRIIPIINENDTVAVEELRFGDNDILSVLVSELVGVERLFLMTSVDGLYPDGDLTKNPIEEVNDMDEVMNFASDMKGKFSSGGMSSKLAAVKRATESGIDVWILNGRHPVRLLQLMNGKGIGTHFKAVERDEQIGQIE